MRLQLLYVDDCPTWQLARDRLTDACGQLDLSADVELLLVATPQDAERLSFRGSPTVLIDGADPFAGPDDAVGFTCRLYATPAGPAGAPTVEQLVSALRLMR